MENLTPLLTKLNEKKAYDSALDAEIQALFDADCDKWALLQDEIKSLTEGEKLDYAWDSHGEIVSYVSSDAIAAIEQLGLGEYFETYLLNNHCIRVDFVNKNLIQNIGPALIINESGDVYDQDSGKVVIDHEECEIRDGDYGELCEFKRAYLIEKYMEATGCYPGVFATNSRGTDIWLVDTSKLASKYNPENEAK